MRKVLKYLVVQLMISLVLTQNEGDVSTPDGEDETETKPKDIPQYAPKCLYDYLGNRVNEGCPSEKPPECEKGILVQTISGEEHEMCCCNYANSCGK
ncbi:CLUMA_CG015632, isoform A [Clunio marinus]|uniref:CLUMA_CG015632, isoform A n=1 Tax=Clunio marinus TaxID=568069 RepID=A0A1J1ITQ5_9DIPT|nr:CLUMA_CG015632, isoform A [Clunio marinus]